jgi:hypothetical protein
MPRKLKKKFKAHFCETEKERKKCRVLCQNWFGDWVFSIAEITVTLPAPVKRQDMRALKRSGDLDKFREEHGLHSCEWSGCLKTGEFEYREGGYYCEEHWKVHIKKEAKNARKEN